MDDSTTDQAPASGDKDRTTAPPPPAGTSRPQAAPAGGPTGAKPPVKRGPLFAVVALVLLMGSIFAGNAIFKRDRPVGALPTPTASPTAKAPATKSFRDAASGIAFDYPADWSELESPTVGATTKAILGTGRGELLKLDVFALEEPPTTETIATRQVQDALDKIISENADATITLRELKNVNGVNTWHYISQFRDPELGVGVHDVWFFFSGVKLEKLVFQAFPISEYNSKYKAEFDDVVRSYHTVPRGKAGAPPAPSQPAPAPSK
jgi:hypothetical protein